MPVNSELLTAAEKSHADLLEAWTRHNEERARFMKLLGPEALGSEAMGSLRKYLPMVMKYAGAATGGAGGLAVLGNVFPKLTSILGMVGS